MSGLSLFGSGLTITEAQGPTYYLGTWDASTNTPTLVSSTAPAGPGGSYYIVSVAGTTNLNGITDWTVGDWVIWSGSVWQKLEGGMTSVTVGSTQIAGGTTGRVLYDNAGVLGEMTNTGTGTVNVLQTSPALITPALGIATGTSLALGGATIGGNALAVTGTTVLGGSLLMGAATSITVAAGGIVGVGFALDQQAAGDISTKAAGRIGFSSTSNPSTAPDSAFSRIAAGIIGVGTGAAGNVAGVLQAASIQLGGSTSSFPMLTKSGSTLQVALADGSGWARIQSGDIEIRADTTYTAGGSANMRIILGSGSVGIHVGSGAPTITTAKGNLYLKSDGIGQPYYNNNGTTGYTELMGAIAVNSVSPTSPNRTISISVGGTTYYLAAKTTND